MITNHAMQCPLTCIQVLVFFYMYASCTFSMHCSSNGPRQGPLLKIGVKLYTMSLESNIQLQHAGGLHTASSYLIVSMQINVNNSQQRFTSKLLLLPYIELASTACH